MWELAVSLEELKESKTKRVKINGKDILVIFHKDEVFAMDNRCNHYGHGYLLQDARIRKHIITCPGHYAQFDIRTGKLVTLPDDGDDKHICNQGVYEIKVDLGDVYVDVSKALTCAAVSGN